MKRDRPFDTRQLEAFEMLCATDGLPGQQETIIPYPVCHQSFYADAREREPVAS